MLCPLFSRQTLNVDMNGMCNFQFSVPFSKEGLGTTLDLDMKHQDTFNTPGTNKIYF